MAQQLAFDLPSKPALDRDAFFVSDANRLAVAQLEQFDAWPDRKAVLCGPEGSGKTHLAHVWAEDAQGIFITPNSKDLPQAGRNIVIDNADAWKDAQETVLFHLHNHVLANGGHLLLTATQPPALWGTTLPDLASRMQATTTVTLNQPDDALLAALLVKLFDDRQVAISPQIIEFLVRRMPRSTGLVQRLVDALDQAALELGKPISRSLASQVLDNLAEAMEN
ncbi:MAG: chromosomal replication initiator DnaA [Rhodobacteraceae bacterium]|nr:chromosomal replication initiator DnaA [Paracoccaceae bacterium]